MTTPTSSPRAATRLRAPELTGRGWLNTGGEQLSLADLRGRIVVLDFWTFCCVNCLHVLDELRPLEEKYADSLVLIGVHSPKFEHEADPDALAAAVERYAVHHPVLDDPELATWQAYTARAWPTLVVIDPEGYIVASMSGEGHAHGLSVLIEELIAEHSAKGTLRQGDSPYAAPPPPETALRFPGKAAVLPDGSFVVSDTAHHEVVHLEADLVTERARFGGPGVLNEPQGVLVLPGEVADRVGYDVVVADSVNHQVKGLRLADGALDRPGRHRPAAARALRQRAGPASRTSRRPGTSRGSSTVSSSRWRAPTSCGPCTWRPTRRTTPSPSSAARPPRASATVRPTRRGSPSRPGWPSRRTAAACGSPTPRPRRCARSTSPTTASSWTTHVGQGLFDFGHRDGAADQALLQHPLGVTVLPDGSVAVSDTYNGAIRRFDPVPREVSTPGDGAARAERRRRRAATATAAPPGRRGVGGTPARADPVAGQGPARRRPGPPDPAPAQEVAPGSVQLRVNFTPPTGQKLDYRWGDPTRLMVSATPAGLLARAAAAPRA